MCVKGSPEPALGNASHARFQCTSSGRPPSPVEVGGTLRGPRMGFGGVTANEAPSPKAHWAARFLLPCPLWGGRRW